MKQALSIFLYCIALSFSSFSQGLYGEIEGGYNFPLGQFKTATGFTGGIVFPGFHAGGAVGYKFNATWSLGMRTIYIRNETNPPPTISISTIPVWRSQSLLLSAKMSRPIFEHLYAEFEGQAGYMWADFPFTYFFRQNLIGQGSQKSSGIVYGARIGFKYYLKEKIAYKVSANYLESHIERSNDQQTLKQITSLALLSMGLLLEL